eukprot:5986664-Pleurochrysis_carterae.AAC.2
MRGGEGSRRSDLGGWSSDSGGVRTQRFGKGRWVGGGWRCALRLTLLTGRRGHVYRGVPSFACPKSSATVVGAQHLLGARASVVGARARGVLLGARARARA